MRLAREEVPDKVPIFRRGHAAKILDEYEVHFNTHRPHQARQQLTPDDDPDVVSLPRGQILRRQTVVGVINEFRRAA